MAMDLDSIFQFLLNPHMEQADSRYRGSGATVHGSPNFGPHNQHRLVLILALGQLNCFHELMQLTHYFNTLTRTGCNLQCGENVVLQGVNSESKIAKSHLYVHSN